MIIEENQVDLLEDFEENEKNEYLGKRGKDLSEFEKGFITACFKLKRKSAEIIELLQKNNIKRSYRTVKDFVHDLKINNFVKSENSPVKRSNCGRKSQIGLETGKKILDQVEENRMTTGTSIQRDTTINHKNLNVSTINRFLNKKGYYARRL